MLRRIDRWVYLGERLLVVTFLIAMALVVFLDVVHRTFADPESKLAAWALKAVVFFGAELAPDGLVAQRIHDLVPWLGGLAFVGLTYFALRTAKLSRPLARGRALVFAAVVVALAYVAVRAFIVAIPNGLIWSQPLALIMTLWVGFLGASMCTYEGKHLKVEAVQRYLPPPLRRITVVISALLTAGFCLLLAWASLDYVRFHYQEWVETEFKGGMFQGVAVPRWIGFSVLPISLVIMSLRFLAVGWSAARGAALPATEGVPEGVRTSPAAVSEQGAAR